MKENYYYIRNNNLFYFGRIEWWHNSNFSTFSINNLNFFSQKFKKIKNAVSQQLVWLSLYNLNHDFFELKNNKMPTCSNIYVWRLWYNNRYQNYFESGCI